MVVVLKITEIAATIRPRGGRRLSAGRLRDRQSASRLVRRYRHARLDQRRRRSGATPNSATTASLPRSSARRTTRRSSRSLMSCARWRPATTCVRRPWSRTCIAPTATAAPTRERGSDAGEVSDTVSTLIVATQRTGAECTASPADRFASLALRVVALVLGGLSLFAPVSAGAAWWIATLGPPPLGKDVAFSTRVVDRDGRLLRAYATERVAGGCRRGRPMSIRASSPCCLPMRTSASAPIAASIRSRCCARHCNSSRSGHSIRRFDIDHAGGAASGAAQQAQPRRQAPPDGARRRDRTR